MKVRELIAALLDARNQDFDVVIQKNYEDGGFTLHPVLLQVDGHIGHSGPVLQIGASLESTAERKMGDKPMDVSAGRTTLIKS